MKTFVAIYSWSYFENNEVVTPKTITEFNDDEMESLGMTKDSDDYSIYEVKNLNKAINKLKVGEELELDEPFNGPFVFMRIDKKKELVQPFINKWALKWLSEEKAQINRAV